MWAMAPETGNRKKVFKKNNVWAKAPKSYQGSHQLSEADQVDGGHRLAAAALLLLLALLLGCGRLRKKGNCKKQPL